MSSYYKRLSISLAACFTVLGITAAAALTRPEFPSLQLEYSATDRSGQADIAALGTKLPAVSSWYGWTPSVLKFELDNWHGLAIDSEGRVYGREQSIAANDIADPVPPLVPWQRAEPFHLNSKPGAARTIYLDFDGASTTETPWRRFFGNEVPAFTTDDSPEFSATELHRIQRISQRVAEDYAPFDVNVTTERPDPAKLLRSNEADQEYGTTVAIFSKNERNPNNAVSYYVNSFADVDGNTPGGRKLILVNASKISSSSDLAVGRTISRAIGHALGLRPDVSAVGSGFQRTVPKNGWAPLMGNTISAEVAQFSMGEYAGAANKEDDFRVMEANGMPLRSDDHGSSRTQASAMRYLGPVPNQGNFHTIEGVIERPGDADSFVVNAGVGRLRATAFSEGDNADLEIRLFNSAGGELLRGNNPDLASVGSMYQITVPGTYYVQIRGAGNGEPMSGNTDYGSRGSYRLRVDTGVTDKTLPTARLTASATEVTTNTTVTFDASTSTDDQPGLTYSWDLGEGTRSSGASTIAWKTYTKPGTYNVYVQVKDSDGFSSVARTTIKVVSEPAAVNVIQLRSVTVIKTHQSPSFPYAYHGKGTVIVTDGSGNPLPDVNVGVTWSNNATVTRARTDAQGQVSFYTLSDRACFAMFIRSVEKVSYVAPTGALPMASNCNLDIPVSLSSSR